MICKHVLLMQFYKNATDIQYITFFRPMHMVQALVTQKGIVIQIGM